MLNHNARNVYICIYICGWGAGWGGVMSAQHRLVIGRYPCEKTNPLSTTKDPTGCRNVDLSQALFNGRHGMCTCMLCLCELVNPEIEEEPRLWLVMHCCLFRTGTSATIMMMLAGQCVSQISLKKTRTASKKDADGFLVGFANTEFDVTISKIRC